MMILKTNQLKHYLLITGLLVLTDPVLAGSRFDCLRDLVPITDRASLGSQRKNVEAPFFINNNSHLVFPEVNKDLVTGFFLYGKKGAWYYDSIEESQGKLTPIKVLKPVDRAVYELVAQPDGLETVAILFLPGFRGSKRNKDGPVVLGASVLPVVGALVSRPEQSQNLYSDPAKASDDEISRWLRSHSYSRSPAGLDGDGKPIRTLARLATANPKDQKSLWAPIENEFKLRRNWVKTHNLDEQSFRALSRAMDTTCRE